MFKLIDGYSLHNEVWMMEAKRYEIIEEQTEQTKTINPSMVVISWADWLEYQNLKNK
jgi:hypothetical protein